MEFGGGELTLALSFSALKRLDDPERAVAEARGWSKYVGVVSERPQHVVMKYTRDRDIPKHFLPRPGGEKRRTLEDVKSVSSEYEATDRYVFVGTTEADREAATAAGWEYVPLEEAAEAAGWAVGEREPESGLTIDEDRRDDWP